MYMLLCATLETPCKVRATQFVRYVLDMYTRKGRHETLYNLFGLSFWFVLFSSIFIFKFICFKVLTLLSGVRLHNIHILTNSHFGVLNCRALEISTLNFSLLFFFFFFFFFF